MFLFRYVSITGRFMIWPVILAIFAGIGILDFSGYIIATMLSLLVYVVKTVVTTVAVAGGIIVVVRGVRRHNGGMAERMERTQFPGCLPDNYNVADGLSNLVNAATGGGGWNAGGTTISPPEPIIIDGKPIPSITQAKESNYVSRPMVRLWRTRI